MSLNIQNTQANAPIGAIQSVRPLAERMERERQPDIAEPVYADDRLDRLPARDAAADAPEDDAHDTAGGQNAPHTHVVRDAAAFRLAHRGASAVTRDAPTVPVAGQPPAPVMHADREGAGQATPGQTTGNPPTVAVRMAPQVPATPQPNLPATHAAATVPAGPSAAIAPTVTPATTPPATTPPATGMTRDASVPTATAALPGTGAAAPGEGDARSLPQATAPIIAAPASAPAAAPVQTQAQPAAPANEPASTTASNPVAQSVTGAAEAARSSSEEAGQARHDANQATRRSAQVVVQAQKQQDALAAAARAESRVDFTFHSWGAGHSVVARQQGGEWLMQSSSARVNQALGGSTAPDGVQLKLVDGTQPVHAGTEADADGRRRQQHEQEQESA